MTAFTYVPDRGFSKQTTPRILTTQFGDGYAHRIADGINAINTSWSVVFSSRNLIDSAAIIAFFEGTAGYIPFQWVPPDEATQYNIVCPNWSQSYDSHISRTITATFNRVYQT